MANGELMGLSASVQLFFKPKDEVGIVAYGSEGENCGFVAASVILQLLSALRAELLAAETDNQLNEEQGQDEYRNVEVVYSMDAPTLYMIKRLRQLKPATSEATKVDILDGMIVALDLLFRRTENKKYDKRLLVITDAAAKIADAGDLESVVTMMRNMEVKLQVM
jgi:ATP-dependent DNA helicase 2 subunit 2